jgi:translation initiation factor 6 (eIF-6)
MNQQRSLVAELRALQEARKLEDPRITAMVADVKRIRTEVSGLNSIGNLALGNSRNAVERVAELEEELASVKSDLKLALEAIDNLTIQAAAHLVRIEKMAQWAKTKGNEL